MFRLVHSSRLDRLADALAAVLRVPAGGPFDAEWVVVGSRPLERWLALRLAERLGVCAHVRFLSPSTLLEEVVERTTGAPRDAVRGWRPERLTWRVAAALPARLHEPAFAPVAAYLRGDDGVRCAPGSPRAVAFARGVAGAFARYPLARPELVAAWDAGDDAEASGADAWQPALWRALRGPFPTACAPDGRDAGTGPHIAERAAAAWARLAAHGVPAGVPRRLAWLAHGVVPLLHARTITALAAAGAEVHALLPGAGTGAGAGGGAGNPLRVSLGRALASRDAVLDRAIAAHAPPVARETLDADDGRPDAPPVTLLGRLRADLTGNVTRGATGGPGAPAPWPLARGDTSLRVHACHGPMRQAEVVRDELLRLFDTHPDLRPRDVLVLTPDPATYAPLLEAALGSTSGGPAIPVRVVDHPARRANPAADVVLRVLELAAGRVDAVSVLDLLATPAVAERFGLDEAAHDRLREWARGAGVRWGLDADDRADTHALPRDAEHTWRFGLERLLLGWGMPTDGRTLFAGVLPWDEVEGGDAELLGRFAEACARVFDAVQQARAPHALSAWRDVLVGVGDALLANDDPALVVPRRALRAALDALAEDGAVFGELVTPEAVRAVVAAHFDEPAGAAGAAGAVAVAAMSAGRVVPARVVVCVGLDDGVYPRSRSGAGFDLVARMRRGGGTPPTGDADPNAEDRLRLMEALLAAGDTLVLTYTGRSVRTNEPVPAAVPLGELLDAVDAGFVRADRATGPDGEPRRARTLVEVEHALQPFAAANFAPDAPVWSHDVAQVAGARALSGERATPPPFVARPVAARAAGVPREVAVDALARWLAKPSKTFVTHVLGVRFGAPEAVDVLDPVELDALEAYAVRATLLQRLVDGADGRAADAVHELAVLRAAARLPHGPLGALAHDAERRAAAGVARPARALRRGPPAEPVLVDCTVGGWRLTGRVGPTWDGGLCEVIAGKARARHVAGFWVRHLALHLAPHDGAPPPTSRLVSLADDKGRNVYRLGPVADARSALGTLLDAYARGTREPVPLFPEASRAYAEALAGASAGGPGGEPDGGHAAGLRAARAQYADGWGANEGADAYVARLFAHGDPLAGDAADFAALARALWGPVLAHTTQLAH